MKISARKLSQSSAAVAVVILLIVGSLYLFRPSVSLLIDGAEIEQGHAYSAYLPPWTNLFAAPENRRGVFHDPALLENGRSLEMGKSLHEDIRRKGGGRWSYWGRALLFSKTPLSATDARDQRYELILKFDPPILLILLIIGSAMLLAIPYLLHQGRHIGLGALARTWAQRRTTRSLSGTLPEVLPSRKLLALTAAFGLLTLACLYSFRPSISLPLEKMEFQETHVYASRLPSWAALFSAPEDQKSIFRDHVLLENGKVIGPSGSIHDEIRKHGGGRWSYWGDTVYFSPSSLAQDVAVQDQDYRLVLKFNPPVTALLLVVAISMLLATPYLLHELRRLQQAGVRAPWPHIELNYSPEIDGLRALAVMLVCLYHFNFPYLKGGFVGVDIFFVISGFLITRIICAELHDKKFTFKNFYFRRAKRIFPALIVVCAATIPFAAAIFPPDLFSRYGESLFSSSLFISNIYFYSQTGYFDYDAITKPLLHTWSLGVEEQFYIVFPLLLFLLHRYLPFSRTAAALFVFGLMSLVASQWFLGIDRSAAFFLSPFRFFEFAIGASLVFVRTIPFNRHVLALLALLGFSLVLIPAFVYTSYTPFPGISGLAVCSGAFLLIYCRHASIVSKTLGMGFLINIGLISYSVYLVHWPLVVFYKAIRIGRDSLSMWEGLVLMGLTLGLAALLYRYVEMPCRNMRMNVSYRGMKVSLAVFIAALLPTSAIGLAIHAGAGLPQRFPSGLQQHLAIPVKVHNEHVWAEFNEKLSRPFTEDGTKKILIAGDSQAADFLNILHEAVPDSKNISTILLPVHCQAVIPASAQYYDRLNVASAVAEDCRQRHVEFRGSTHLATADIVVLSASWRPEGVEQLAHTLHQIKERNPSAKIVIVGLKTQSRGGLEIVFLSRWTARPPEEISFQARTPVFDRINDRLRNFGEQAFVIDIYKEICDRSLKRCTVFADDGATMFSDAGHLTRSGTLTLGTRLRAAKQLELFE
jgi:peptidoglycan/LPS O-acetylase OafA/YrhL